MVRTPFCALSLSPCTNLPESSEVPLFWGDSFELPQFPAHLSEIVLVDEAVIVWIVWIAHTELPILAHLCSFRLAQQLVPVPQRRQHMPLIRMHVQHFARTQDC